MAKTTVKQDVVAALRDVSQTWNDRAKRMADDAPNPLEYPVASAQLKAEASAAQYIFAALNEVADHIEGINE